MPLAALMCKGSSILRDDPVTVKLQRLTHFLPYCLLSRGSLDADPSLGSGTYKQINSDKYVGARP